MHSGEILQVALNNSTFVQCVSVEGMVPSQERLSASIPVYGLEEGDPIRSLEYERANSRTTSLATADRRCPPLPRAPSFKPARSVRRSVVTHDPAAYSVVELTQNLSYFGKVVLKKEVIMNICDKMLD
ncbi:hypothetical protein EVAR_96903_1 [Eumeta japonica]|uniref:Uncharacterized protein n=1 Tax=Eumeta variegata TaxID=151549 RepID=A0A4C1WEM6_EUMVA|nr:hypothetical protein EVAR_96903_1 [Eumeta japonica]